MAKYLLLLAAQAWAEPQLRGVNRTVPQLEKMLATSSSHLVWGQDHSFCLSSDANRIGDGVDIQLWKCDNTWSSGGQNFFIEKQEGRIRMQQNPQYCLGIEGNSYRNGARIQLSRCDDANKHQVWSFTDSLQAANSPESMCLVINYNEAFNGAKIQLWSCDWKDYQSWDQISLGASQRVAFYRPSGEDCEGPWRQVTSVAQCEEGATALAPAGGGCFDDKSPWAAHVDMLPTCRGGCMMWGACQGCSLQLGFVAHGGNHCPMHGECWSGNPICQMQI